MAGQRLVAVTGASGYIALHVIAQLLDAQYAVRGTLRDMARAKKVREALNRHTDTSNLSFCECNLLSDDGWDDALSGCTFLVHTASPLPMSMPRAPRLRPRSHACAVAMASSRPVWVWPPTPSTR